MQLTLTGTTPLIMHNERLADPYDQYSRAISAITSKRNNKTEDDDLEVSRLQFAGGMYYTPDTGPYLPGRNLIRCLRNTGNLVAKNKGGKKIERGFILLNLHVPLNYPGTRNVDAMWGDGTTYFVDRRIVKIPAGGRVPVTRPIFTDWSATFDFELDPQEIDLTDLQAYAERAGRIEGICDARRIGYGRFTTEVTP